MHNVELKYSSECFCKLNVGSVPFKDPYGTFPKFYRSPSIQSDCRLFPSRKENLCEFSILTWNIHWPVSFFSDNHSYQSSRVNRYNILKIIVGEEVLLSLEDLASSLGS